ncbi:MAG TPA: Ig-like domain-containing protein, partial [Pirellulaceae bacterium]|nr:Ig-like domain-containing protein [Pirellulaceae bacterium]
LVRVGADWGTNTDLWPVYWYGSTTLDASQYLTFSLTVAPADAADFTRLKVSFQEWVTGTSNVAIRTSLDGFAANVGGVQLLADSGSADVTFDLTSLAVAPGTTTFRIYVFDAVDGTAGWRDIRGSLASGGAGVLLEGAIVPNPAPVAIADAATTSEDVATVVDVLSNDSSPSGLPLTPTIVTAPAHGTAAVNADGTITYSPSANYFGVDSFTYRVTDGVLISNSASMALAINPVNDAPVAVSDAAVTDKNVAVTITLLANDSDIDGDALTPVVVSPPSHGSVTISGNGTATYTPSAGYVGGDSLTYRVTDGSLLSNTVTVSLTVNDPVIVLASFDPIGAQGSANLHGVSTVTGATVGDLRRVGASYGTNTNDWPVYWYSATALDPNQYLTFSLTLPGANQTDLSRLTLSFQEWVTGTSNVAVRTSVDGFATNIGGVQTLADVGSADLQFDLTALPWLAGTVTFRIYLFDNVDGTAGWRDIRSSLWNNGRGVLLEGRVAPNNAPTASDDSATTNEDAGVTVNILANDGDADGQSLTPTVVTPPAHGTVTMNANGTITYMPAANYNGVDNFIYRVSDGGLNSGNATVSITITPVNDAPIAVNDSYATGYATTLNVPVAGVLANDTDVDSDTLTATLLTGTSHGSLSFNSNGAFVYTPLIGYVGSDGFSYSTSDGVVSSSAIVSLTVNPPPDDYGNLPNGTAYALALSGGTKGRGSITGNFELPGDRDVFQITVVKGVLAVALSGIDNLNTYL